MLRRAHGTLSTGRGTPPRGGLFLILRAMGRQACALEIAANFNFAPLEALGSITFLPLTRRDLSLELEAYHISSPEKTQSNQTFFSPLRPMKTSSTSQPQSFIPW